MTRKIIYSLLFSRPLFEYAVTVNNQKHIDVLIIGDNDTVLEAFKAVYWCCQMSDDYYTSITLAQIQTIMNGTAATSSTDILHNHGRTRGLFLV